MSRLTPAAALLGIFLGLVPGVSLGADDPPAPPLRPLEAEQPARTRSADTDLDPRPINRVLAVVGGRAVTMRDYQERYGESPLTRDRLRNLVDRLLLVRAARDRDLLPDTGQVDRLVQRRMEAMRERAGSRFRRFLRQRSLSEAEFRRRIRERVQREIVTSRLMREVYPSDDRRDTRPAGARVRARLILVESLPRAWDLYRWLSRDPRRSTWNRLFEEYSLKLGRMGKGGDLGWFHWGEFSSAIEYRLYRLPLNAISQPFALRDRYAIVRPTGVRLDPKGSSLDPDALEAYRRYRRRFLREELADRLRESYSVTIPPSVRRRLTDDAPERG